MDNVLPVQPHIHSGCYTSLIFKEAQPWPERSNHSSFFAVLPGTDSLFFVFKLSSVPLHRVLFHNVFIVMIPLLLFILDLFTGGISLFYPVYNNIFFAHVELLFTDGSFTPALEYGISDKIMNMGIGEPAISSENIAVAVLLIISAAISAGGIYRKTKQE
ncbi:Uncharacterised protein [uncultured archaeon]|nr:Uncharacterised protein [uncultured archaeon]